MSKGGYKDRDGVDWYDESMGMPKHGQMHRVTKKYYNEFKEEWCEEGVPANLQVQANIRLVLQAFQLKRLG